MEYCACGCKQKLTGRATKWKSPAHKNAFYTDARRNALGKGLDSLLPEKPKRKAHFGAVIGNPRLEPLLMAIMQRKKMTSLELREINNSVAIATDMSNLRKFYPISRAKLICSEPRKIYEYEWMG